MDERLPIATETPESILALLRAEPAPDADERRAAYRSQLEAVAGVVAAGAARGPR